MTLPLLLTIALGIGSNAAVFGFVRGLITPDLPLPDTRTLISLFTRDAQDAYAAVSYDDYLSLRTHGEAFDALGAAQETRRRVESGDRSSLLAVAAVTPEIAGLLQLPAADGVVLSDRVWRDQFGASKAVSGQPIRVDGIEMTIAAVAPAWLDGLYHGRAVDLWLPLQDEATPGLDRRSLTFSVLGRLRTGVSPARAQAIVNASSRRGGAVTVRPYTGLTPEAATGMSRIGQLLPAAAGLVFLIACANVAAFLLSRASARSHETSVRVALGASRGRLGRQLLSDSILITAAGAALGGLLALWTAQVLPALLFEQDAEQLVFAPDYLAIAAASLACAAITVACGLIPLFEMRHDDPAAVLRLGTDGPTKGMRRLRSGLVVTQTSCCCLLVISTGLLLEGFRTALRTRAATALGEPILATLRAPLGFSRPDLGLEYFGRAEQAVLSLPGISETAWASTPPGGSGAWYAVRIEQPRPATRTAVIDARPFTPRSLDDVVMPPVAGRMFGGGDTQRTCTVVVLNEPAAEQLFGGEAVGRTLEDASGQTLEVIGVVETRRDPSTTATVRPTVYYYAEQTELPGSGAGPATFRLPDREAMTPGLLDAHVVSADYFTAMGLSASAGSLLPVAPPPGTCRVGVINEEAAELYFGGRAVGGAVIDGVGRRTEIVGVVQSSTLRASQRRVEPAIYFPMSQDFLPQMTMIIGAREATQGLIATIAGRLEGVTGTRTRPAVMTLEEHLSRTALAPERVAALLVGAAAAIALALGILGMYGGMADFTRQRRREFALRVALGAQRRSVIRLVLAAAARLAGIGALAGVLGSILVARWLAHVTPNVGSLTLWVWLAGPAVLVAAVALAGVLPARRALMVDPLAIMRDS